MSDAAATHKPYIPATSVIAELRLLPLVVGTALGILFGAASLYLVLKVGLTVSASIPIAVMSISLFRWFSRAFRLRPATILENNIVQTTGSAGESIAFGVGVTMPALLILGHDMDLARIVTVAVLGGLLGILMMIPLRRGLIVKEHGKLAYPEGTACAEVLIAGERGGLGAKTIFAGLGVGFLFKFLNGDGGLRLFKGAPEAGLGSYYKGGSVGLEASPELLGVGYIIGPRIASIMCAGGVLAYLVLIPAITLFGEGLTAPLFPETDRLIGEMSPGQIRNAYILYIGAGAVATGGIISMFRVLPMIGAAFIAGFKDLVSGQKGVAEEKPRTDRDLPMSFVALGSLGLVAALMLLPSLHISLVGALLVLVFGFLFVTVSSRLTGTIGSSSNPISGMTVATLLLTCLIFLANGWTSVSDRVAALSIAAVVCIASSNGGTTSQDLKTGFLVGGTPRAQQIGILVGALISALIIGGTLTLLNDLKTTYHTQTYAGFIVPETAIDPTKREGLGRAEKSRDPATYRVAHFTSDTAPRDESGKVIVPAGKYLVDDAGAIAYLVDPGINGVRSRRDPTPERPDGEEVQKFDAPKAKLMSLIIDGILTQKLPWGLVLIGVFIAVTLEMAGIASLPFAVGVYLPLSASTPIFAGGMVRLLVDRASRDKTEAERESAPGVLLSSGLIAGGTVAGMLLAVTQGFAGGLTEWWDVRRLVPETGEIGAILQSNGAALGMFVLLGLFLLLVGRERLLRGPRAL